MNIIKQLYRQAKLLGCCDKFTGEEDIPQLAELFLSPQGQEFCLKHSFPSIGTIRQLVKEGYDLQPYGIYVDCRSIKLKNEKRIVLIGKTTGQILCDDPELYNITLMHGAKAVVNALKWSVVHTQSDKESSVLFNISDNAIVI